MSTIQDLAVDLGVGERTLRRAAAQGTVRCQRKAPRRLKLRDRRRAIHARATRDYRRQMVDARRVIESPDALCAFNPL